MTVVTGAAGFIGRNVVAELNRRGYANLLLVDRLDSGNKWTNLLGLEFEDLVSPSELLEWMAGTYVPIRAVIHMGACSSTTEADADYLFNNNYRYTRQLCEHALDRSARFIYASSAATYGDGALGYSDRDEITPKLRALNMYGYSKQIFDQWALREGLLDRIVGLKFFNVFGPYEDHKGDMRSVVAKSYEEVLSTGAISLYKSYRQEVGDGEQRRDFIYVDDAVSVLMHFWAEGSPSGLFNCGTGVARSWLDLARAVFAALDMPEDIRFIEMPPTLRDKYQYFTQAETAKLVAAGVNVTFRPLETAIDSYIRGYLAVR